MSHGELRVLYANDITKANVQTKDEPQQKKGQTSSESERDRGREREVKPFAEAGPVYDRDWPR